MLGSKCQKNASIHVNMNLHTFGGCLSGSETRPETHCSYCNILIITFLIISLCSKMSDSSVFHPLIHFTVQSLTNSSLCFQYGPTLVIFFPAWQNWAYLHIFFSLFLTGEMHADLHWECTSRAVLHLPDGRGSDSCAQIEPRCRKQSHERRPCAPLADWWDLRENTATAALTSYF